MAKQKTIRWKTKQCPMSTTATYQDYGAWTWTTDGDEWAWKDGVGTNLFFVLNGELKPMTYAKSLDHAVMWSWGFAAGRDYQQRLKG